MPLLLSAGTRWGLISLSSRQTRGLSSEQCFELCVVGEIQSDHVKWMSAVGDCVVLERHPLPSPHRAAKGQPTKSFETRTRY